MIKPSAVVTLQILSAEDVAEVKEWESFKGWPYQDGAGQAVGYGTELPLIVEEGELLCFYRLAQTERGLLASRPVVKTWPATVQRALVLMGYQIGVHGLLQFSDMWNSLMAKEWTEAHRRALDSAWARQTPQRAQRVAGLIGKAAQSH